MPQRAHVHESHGSQGGHRIVAAGQQYPAPAEFTWRYEPRGIQKSLKKGKPERAESELILGIPGEPGKVTGLLLASQAYLLYLRTRRIYHAQGTANFNELQLKNAFYSETPIIA